MRPNVFLGSFLFHALNIYLVTTFYAHAGSFNVNPVRVYLNQNQKIETLDITNQDDNPLTVHLKVKEWHQEGGEDVYKDTGDLLAVPPIVTIEPRSSQIIRIALRRTPDLVKELTYRLYINEIPVKSSEMKHQPGLLFCLRIGVPVFIEPLHYTPDDPVLQALCEGNKLHLKNTSNKHAYVSTIQDSASMTDPIKVYKYILVDQECIIKLPKACPSNRFSLIVEINNQKRTLDVPTELEKTNPDHSSLRAVKR